LSVGVNACVCVSHVIERAGERPGDLLRKNIIYKKIGWPTSLI